MSGGDTHSLTVTHQSTLSPNLLYAAWTSGWTTWFAEPEGARVEAEVGAPFFFHVAQRFESGAPTRLHPHYGRFLTLEHNVLASFTWVTGGTGGAETTITVQFEATASGTNVTLTHDGFATEAARNGHAGAWPVVLTQQSAKLAALDDAARAELVASANASLSPNRSIPDARFIPVRSYPDVDAAVSWLRDVLECRERLRIPGHRVQLALGTGAVVVAAWDPALVPPTGGRPPASLMVRVRDIDAVYARALASGATGLSAPTDHPYGERQAQVRDPAGHAWTLTQTIADVDPTTWGGIVV